MADGTTSRRGSPRKVVRTRRGRKGSSTIPAIPVLECDLEAGEELRLRYRVANHPAMRSRRGSSAGLRNMQNSSGGIMQFIRMRLGLAAIFAVLVSIAFSQATEQ